MSVTKVSKRDVAQAIPEETVRVLVMGPNYWGQAETYEQALANFKAEGGRVAKGYVVLCYPEGVKNVWVDGFGRTQSEWDLAIPMKDRAPIATLGVHGTETVF